MEKIVRIGTLKEQGHNADLFCKIEINDGKLSISGVVGPKSNGNAIGGCGQIDMEFWHRDTLQNDRRTTAPTKPSEITFAPGWTADKWLDFLDIWHKWHLNDMKAACKHQTGPDWDTGRELIIYHYRLRKEIDAAIRDAKHRAQACITSGETFTPTAEETRLANLNHEITFEFAELPQHLARDYEPNGPQYSGDHYNKASEKKNAGWVYPSEHPRGLLTKACPVCGYEYGSSWHKVEVPSSVIDFLHGLPDADKKPAWV